MPQGSSSHRGRKMAANFESRTRQIPILLTALIISLMLPAGLCQATPVSSESAHPPKPGSLTDEHGGAGNAIKPPVRLATNTTSDDAEVIERLTAMDTTLRDLATRSNAGHQWSWLTPTFALLGVLVGAGIKSLMDLRLASKRAKFETASSLVQWELRQLSELYGPLRALLRESHALYRQMNGVLAQSDPKKFRFTSPSKRGTRDGQDFEIFLNNSWVGFRVILHAEEVYVGQFGVDEYFDALVATGARMKRIIEEKAGYIQPNQAVLGEVFGRYLAHYSVLEKLHAYYKSGKSSSGPIPVALANSAVFPSEIDDLVESGFNAICNELNTWRSQRGT